METSPPPLNRSYALATVGSTCFDLLVSIVSCTESIKLLQDLGIEKLIVQHGSGKPHSPDSSDSFIQNIDYSTEFETLLKNSQLVISAAGAGTIIETLALKKILILIPNQSLLHNHQLQIAKEMESLNQAFVAVDKEQYLSVLSNIHKSLVSKNRQSLVGAHRSDIGLNEESLGGKSTEKFQSIIQSEIDMI